MVAFAISSFPRSPHRRQNEERSRAQDHIRVRSSICRLHGNDDVRYYGSVRAWWPQFWRGGAHGFGGGGFGGQDLRAAMTRIFGAASAPSWSRLSGQVDHYGYASGSYCDCGDGACSAPLPNGYPRACHRHPTPNSPECAHPQWGRHL
jgi:hypothetical protein